MANFDNTAPTPRAQSARMRIHTRKNNFTIIDNAIFRNKGLSLKAKGLLCTMLSLPEDWNYTVRGLTAIVKESSTCVAATIQELERAGYIIRSRQRAANGMFGAMIYDVYENPADAPKRENDEVLARIELNPQAQEETPIQEPSLPVAPEAPVEEEASDAVDEPADADDFERLCSKSLKAVPQVALDATREAYEKALASGYTADQILMAYDKYVERYRSTNNTLRYAKRLERWLSEGGGLAWYAPRPQKKQLKRWSAPETPSELSNEEVLKLRLGAIDTTFAELQKNVSVIAAQMLKAQISKDEALTNRYKEDFDTAATKANDYFATHKNDVLALMA